MRSSIVGVVVVGLLASACGDKDQAPPPKTPETTAVATTTAPPPPPVDTTPPPPPPAPKPTMAELQQKAGQTLMEGFNSHDAKKVASVYADDAIFRMAGAPADAKGKDAITAGVQMIFDSFSGLKEATQFAFVKNDVVVVVWQMTGTHSGNFMGMKATEKPVGWTGASVMWFNADGQIKEEHAYWDVGTVMAQIGAAPKGMKARALPALAAQPTMFTALGNDAEQKNVDALKTWYTAFEQKTPDTFLAPLTEETEWDDMANPMGVMKGTKVAKQYFGDLKKGFPDVKTQIANSWGIADFVITENVMTGTNNGAFMGKPASKKPINLHGLDVVQLKDGKVTKGWSFMNGGELGMQLGWIKMPGDAKAADPKATTTGTKPATPAKPAPAAPATKPAPKK
jgi:steroid delta-isomerase-like uncharacterized protein